MRWFKLILPAANVVLAVLLFHWGDIQARRVLIAQGGAQEGLMELSAKARYFDYAINAPVWALLRGRDTFGRLWAPSSYWKGDDLYFLLGVSVMWFLIGVGLDRLRYQPQLQGSRKRLPKITTALGLVVYGFFICYQVFPVKPGFISYAGYVHDYLPTMFNMLHHAGWWWLTLGLAWGLMLMVVGARILWEKAEQIPQL